MTTRICTLLIFIAAFTSHGQNVTLLKNFNPKVKELKHYLNPTRDSLILRCDSKIIKVDIFNEDYDQLFEINNNSANISLENLPEGKFTVDVYLEKKIAEMHIIKRNYVEEEDIIETENSKDDDAQWKGTMLDEEMNAIDSQPRYDIEFLLTGNKPNTQAKTKQKFYWIQLEIINGTNSYKSMKLVDEAHVLKMISKNKLETKVNRSQQNKLTVWEVYDTVKFMEKQTENPKYINSASSDIFNVNPFYVTSKNIIAQN
ncbi:hypothetical protein [Winogradskyella sp.]|uniref:hypothetical protein n=1 Tax=Winogradskyella sp. TaxID=1883156 RepID=UPI0035196173